MRLLWVNADDFGLTEGVSEGILRSMRDGAVHTTTAMICCPASHERVVRLGSAIQGRMGLHLQLTDGAAMNPAPARLADRSGRFPRSRKDLGSLDCSEVLREWRMQIAAMRSLGFHPTHIDTHHDVHWREGALEAYVELAREERLPVRGGPPWLVRRLRAEGLCCAAVTRTFGDRGGISLDGFVEEAATAAAECGPDDCIEISCHPGYVDGELGERSFHVAERQKELDVLCHPDLKERLRRAGIELAESFPLASHAGTAAAQAPLTDL